MPGDVEERNLLENRLVSGRMPQKGRLPSRWRGINQALGEVDGCGAVGAGGVTGLGGAGAACELPRNGARMALMPPAPHR